MCTPRVLVHSFTVTWGTLLPAAQPGLLTETDSGRVRGGSLARLGQPPQLVSTEARLAAPSPRPPYTSRAFSGLEASKKRISCPPNLMMRGLWLEGLKTWCLLRVLWEGRARPLLSIADRRGN